MSDRDFDELVDQMKRTHNPPPPVPRDRMWARIQERRQAARPAAERHWWRPWRVGLGMAAVLVLGIAVGRMTLRPDAPPQVAAGTGAPAAVAPDRSPSGSALVSFAAASLFSRADVLLTDLQTGRCDDERLAPVPAWAGGMLAQTRLLLDSELAADPDMKALLLDLELILARIADLSREDCNEDVNKIRQDIRDKATLDRLRLAAAGA